MNIENIKRVMNVTSERNYLILHLITKNMPVDDIISLKVKSITPDFIKKYDVPIPQLCVYLNKEKGNREILFPAKNGGLTNINNLTTAIENACDKIKLKLTDLEIPSLKKKAYVLLDSQMTQEKVMELVKRISAETAATKK